MPSTFELDSVYMGTAILHAKLSKARRKSVGASIIKNETIKRYNFKYNNKSALYNQAIYVVTLDRLMQEREDNK